MAISIISLEKNRTGSDILTWRKEELEGSLRSLCRPSISADESRSVLGDAIPGDASITDDLAVDLTMDP
jgi:hypothetical protein